MKLTIKYLPHRILGCLASMGEKRKILEDYGWYRNMHGGWAHPHVMDYMTFVEIWKYNLEELEYKLQHGSQASLPVSLHGGVHYE